ncbi:MAG: hypothetical protein KDK29_03335 [Sedimentitalea sp.]|nr:hypothetical protein [Sedimentitalea sp.]
MFLELIATVFAGLAMAGVVMLVNRLTGGRLPRWTAPVAAGLAMLATTISNEYSWYSRTTEGLPEGLTVAQAVESRRAYRPWTYLVPYVDRFVALDEASLQRHPALPDQRIADLYFFGRWSPVKKMPVLFDCAGHRQASLMDGVEFDPDGQVSDAAWIRVEAGDPVLTAVCEVS